MRRVLGSRRHRHDVGAAAVEFALVLPVLLVLVIGIVNYGLWFNDSLSMRQGVREGARRAAVLNPSTACTGTGMAAYACTTRAQLVESGGVAAVKVFAPSGWVRGQEVVVCALVTAVNFTTVVPMPAGGLIKSRTVMSIENVTPMPTDFSYQDAAPTGGDWTWCTS